MFYLYDIGTGNVFVKILRRKVEEIILSYALLSTAVIYNKLKVIVTLSALSNCFTRHSKRSALTHFFYASN